MQSWSNVVLMFAQRADGGPRQLWVTLVGWWHKAHKSRPIICMVFVNNFDCHGWIQLYINQDWSYILVNTSWIVLVYNTIITEGIVFVNAQWNQSWPNNIGLIPRACWVHTYKVYFTHQLIIIVQFIIDVHFNPILCSFTHKYHGTILIKNISGMDLISISDIILCFFLI